MQESNVSKLVKLGIKRSDAEVLVAQGLDTPAKIKQADKKNKLVKTAQAILHGGKLK